MLVTGAWTAPERCLDTIVAGGAGSMDFHVNNSHSRRATWLALDNMMPDGVWEGPGVASWPARSIRSTSRSATTGRCQPRDDRRGTMLVRKR
jgi:hypothetical protein